jgi:hypothetical protein
LLEPILLMLELKRTAWRKIIQNLKNYIRPMGSLKFFFENGVDLLLDNMDK